MSPDWMSAIRSCTVIPASGPVRSASVIVPEMSAKPHAPSRAIVPSEVPSVDGMGDVPATWRMSQQSGSEGETAVAPLVVGVVGAVLGGVANVGVVALAPMSPMVDDVVAPDVDDVVAPPVDEPVVASVVDVVVDGVVVGGVVVGGVVRLQASALEPGAEVDEEADVVGVVNEPTSMHPVLPGSPGTWSGTTIGPATPGAPRCRCAMVGSTSPNTRAEYCRLVPSWPRLNSAQAQAGLSLGGVSSLPDRNAANAGWLTALPDDTAGASDDGGARCSAPASAGDSASAPTPRAKPPSAASRFVFTSVVLPRDVGTVTV